MSAMWAIGKEKYEALAAACEPRDREYLAGFFDAIGVLEFLAQWDARDLLIGELEARARAKNEIPFRRAE